MTPIAFKIEPKSKTSVEMVCKSEIVGDFTLKGYRIDLYGLIYEVYFEQLLSSRRELDLKKKYKVSVIDTIPALKVDFAVVKNPLENYLNVEEGDEKRKIVKNYIFDGEERNFTIAIENISHIPISHLDVNVTDEEIKKENGENIIFNFQDFGRNLNPGEKMIIEGQMIGKIDSSKCEATLNQFLNISYQG